MSCGKFMLRCKKSETKRMSWSWHCMAISRSSNVHALTLEKTGLSTGRDFMQIIHVVDMIIIFLIKSLLYPKKKKSTHYFQRLFSN